MDLAVLHVLLFVDDIYAYIRNPHCRRTMQTYICDVKHTLIVTIRVSELTLVPI